MPADESPTIRALVPLADGGLVREALADELIPAPPGTLEMLLPQRRPLTTIGPIAGRKRAGGRAAGRVHAPAAAGVRGRARRAGRCRSSATRSRASSTIGFTWRRCRPTKARIGSRAALRAGSSKALIDARAWRESRTTACLRQVALCSREYGCFTAQNVFLERGEAALPVSPKCNARCIGCISEQEPEAGMPSPQTRIADEAAAQDLARVGDSSSGARGGRNRLVRAGLRRRAAACARSRSRARSKRFARRAPTERSTSTRTAACRRRSSAASMPGLDAVRISLNSFRPRVYAAYYRPIGYGLDDVFESIRLAVARGLRVSLNLLTHPGVTDDEEEIAAMEAFLRERPVAMVQTRTLNIDPASYFDAVGRPRAPFGMRRAIERIRVPRRASETSRTRTRTVAGVKLWQILVVVGLGHRVTDSSSRGASRTRSGTRRSTFFCRRCSSRRPGTSTIGRSLRQWIAIATLAGPGVLLTASIVAGALSIVRVPFGPALLAGAILSATDPIAVVAVFRRLEGSQDARDDRRMRVALQRCGRGRALSRRAGSPWR